MSISGVGQNYYQNNVTSAKNKKNMNGTEETGGMRELTEAEEMELSRRNFTQNLIGFQRIKQSLIWRSIYRRRLLKI